MIRCETCHYFSENYCHRNPPVLLFDAKGEPASSFPPTGEQLWCGEWRLSWRRLFLGWHMARTG